MNDTINIETNEKETFSNRLKRLRLEKGFSQKDIAKILNIHHVNYGRYVRGDSRPSADTLAKLADALDISVDYLLEGEETDAAVANLEDKKLLQMFAKIEKLSPKDKKVVITLLDAFIKKKEIENLVIT
jgi:transcriptional regulator with XRE-family HTH domain